MAGGAPKPYSSNGKEYSLKPASVSALKMYQQCPRRYSYAYREHLPAEIADGATLASPGTLCRQALDTFHMRRETSWDALDRALSEAWQPGLFADERRAAEAYHRGRWLLWENFERIRAGEPVRYAYAFDLDFAGGRFRGKVDRVDRIGDGLGIVTYAFSFFEPERDGWPQRIYAAVIEKHLRAPVTSIRVLTFSGDPPEIALAPGDADSIEREVLRLRRAIEGADRFDPLPGPHCRRCPYAQICDAAQELPRAQPVRRDGRESFRLFRAVEALLHGGETISGFQASAEAAVRLLDASARVIWLGGAVLAPEIAHLVDSQSETEGEVSDENGTVRLVTGASLLVPVSDWCIVVFPGAVSRTSAEILGRSLRISLERTRYYHRAVTDGLTGLTRREIFDAHLHAGQDHYSVIMCDVDRFKSINDTWGHDAGDVVLKAVAASLGSRPGAVAYRLGGEEFALLVPSRDTDYLRDFAEGLRREIAAAPVRVRDTEIPVTASFGIAMPHPDEPAVARLKRADLALYEAKEQGRNRTVMAPCPA